MIKICFLISGLVLLQSCTLCKDSTLEGTIQCLNNMPVRDIDSDPAVTSYLQKHPVIVSFTTSPERLKNLTPMLRTLDTTHVTHIWLALPKQYKNEEDYGPVPEEILKFPKLEIIARDQFDYGPITKMLPAIEKISSLDPDALVISVDDDTGFPKGMINELIYHSILHPHAVVSGAGNYVEIFGILAEEWPTGSKAKRTPFCGHADLSYCDTVEGWRAVAYKPKLVNVERMKQIVRLSKACRTSDDLVISYVLSESRVEKIRITNKYLQDIHRFDSESDKNALHLVRLNIPGWSPRPSIDARFSGTSNSERYQRCVLDIRS